MSTLKILSRGYNPIQLILGLFTGVWCGASCFGHLDVVRYDTALCDLLGWKRGADHRAYQRYLNKFSQAVNQRVFGNLFRWFFFRVEVRQLHLGLRFDRDGP